MSISSLGFLSLLTIATVQFDVQPIAPATVVENSSVAPQMPNSRFVQVRLDSSVIVPTAFQGDVVEAVIQISSRKESIQVADYWPKTEMYTTVVGYKLVAENSDHMQRMSLNAVGGYPGIVSANGNTYQHEIDQRAVQYEEEPAKKLLTASGTVGRRTGVYFKLRSTPQMVLEGSRTFVLLLEVPQSWRGDVLEVEMVAYGKGSDNPSKKSKQVGRNRFLVAVYSDGDIAAAESAMRFVQQQSKLRQVANYFADKVEHKSFPSPIHRLGQVLDIYEPIIPSDYLEKWLFGQSGSQPPSALPVDLRVAMLDYADQRTQLESLSGAIIR